MITPVRKIFSLAPVLALTAFGQIPSFADAGSLRATPVSYTVQENFADKYRNELLAQTAVEPGQIFKQLLDSYQPNNDCQYRCRENGYDGLNICLGKYRLVSDQAACIDQVTHQFKMCTLQCPGNPGPDETFRP